MWNDPELAQLTIAQLEQLKNDPGIGSALKERVIKVLTSRTPMQVIAPQITAPLQPGSDDLRVRGLVASICGGLPIHVVATFTGEPYSKARPRFSAGKVYSSKKQRDAERFMAEKLALKVPALLPGNLGVACIFFRSKGQRIDIDNMVKHVFDAATGVCWHDDSQVTAVIGVLEYDPASPRTVLAIASHASSMDRMSPADRSCVRCGMAFTPEFVRSPKKFCGTRCASLSRGEDLRVTVKCVTCEVPFRRGTAAQRFCSPECAYKAKSISMSQRPVAFCADCGKKLSAPGYSRCRECWKVCRRPK